MAKTSAITLRLPPRVKAVLRGRAGKSHRSLSAEALAVIESGLIYDIGPATGHFLGMFAGGRVPTDEEIAEVRSELWSRLRTP